MAKFSEDTLTNWTNPPSDSEETKLENAERAIKDAINADDKLNKMTIEIFGQGSYANDTNVRLNSDVDINVKYSDGFYFQLPDGKSKNDYGLNTPSEYSVEEFKNDVETALVRAFGRNSVIRKNKCLQVLGNSYRIQTDVVPTWEYRRYDKDGGFVPGTKFKSDSSGWIVNFSKQHIVNGKQKNSDTTRRFKKLTRIFKMVRYQMIEDKISVSDNITSFLIECLVWNTPNNIFNNHNTWTDRLKECIRHLYHSTKEEDSCKEWGEVSDLLYLFHSGRKWSREDVNAFILQAWNYLEFKD